MNNVLMNANLIRGILFILPIWPFWSASTTVDSNTVMVEDFKLKELVDLYTGTQSHCKRFGH
jgi:hypothetical protein